jgi:protein TonB
LTVDPSGRVSNCYISRISSYQVFNSRTCQLLEVHARFEPARNASGTTVEASYSGGVLWDFRR